MEAFLNFFSFQDPNVRLVVLGMFFISLSASLVGCFAFLQKKSLVGDAVAHSLLPGIAMAFILSGSKDPWVLIIGALISGWISIIIMEYLANKTKLKTDASIALVLSVMFGLGILMLTYIQHSDFSNQTGLDKFLFGKAASLTKADIRAFGVVTGVILVVVALFYKEFKLVAFNLDFAESLGLPTKLINFLMNTLLVLAIITGIQAVGVVLMAALLIAPAAAAKIWTHKLHVMIIIAASVALLSSLLGSYISYVFPNMPTGPWIVLILSFFTVLSLFFAPKKGVVARLNLQRQNQIKINTENLLKALYHLTEKEGFNEHWFSKNDLIEKRHFERNVFNDSVRRLSKKMLILEGEGGLKLTSKGMDEAKRIVRLHRLWEMYLTQRLRFASDHIHSNAETIEHIITPEIERELIKELEHPEVDPHDSVIPYSDKDE